MRGRNSKSEPCDLRPQKRKENPEQGMPRFRSSATNESPEQDISPIFRSVAAAEKADSFFLSVAATGVWEEETRKPSLVICDHRSERKIPSKACQGLNLDPWRQREKPIASFSLLPPVAVERKIR